MPVEWACVLCGRCIQNAWVEQRICINFCVKLELSFLCGNYWDDPEGHSYGQLVISSFITTMHPAHASHLLQRFLAKTSNHPVTLSCYSLSLVPCDFWLFPKLKPPLKGKRFKIVNEIQENTTRQLKTIGRTVWGPKVPTLKGTEASLSYVYLLQ